MPYQSNNLRSDSPKLGRPRKGLHGRLGSLYWAHFVASSLGLTAYAIEQTFLPSDQFWREDGTVRRPGSFDRFLKGTQAPSNAAQVRGAFDWPTMIEARLPGTRKLLEHGLWRLLELRTIDFAELSKVRRRLPRRLNNTIKSLTDHRDSRWPDHGKLEAALDSAKASRHLDQACAVVLLLRWSLQQNSMAIDINVYLAAWQNLIEASPPTGHHARAWSAIEAPLASVFDDLVRLFEVAQRERIAKVFAEERRLQELKWRKAIDAESKRWRNRRLP